MSWSFLGSQFDKVAAEGNCSEWQSVYCQAPRMTSAPISKRRPYLQGVKHRGLFTETFVGSALRVAHKRRKETCDMSNWSSGHERSTFSQREHPYHKQSLHVGMWNILTFSIENILPVLSKIYIIHRVISDSYFLKNWRKHVQ